MFSPRAARMAVRAGLRVNRSSGLSNLCSAYGNAPEKICGTPARNLRLLYRSIYYSITGASGVFRVLLFSRRIYKFCGEPENWEVLRMRGVRGGLLILRNCEGQYTCRCGIQRCARCGLSGYQSAGACTHPHYTPRSLRFSRHDERRGAFKLRIDHGVPACA